MGSSLFGGIRELRRDFLEGQSTPGQVLDATLQHIEHLDPRINCIGELAEISARQAADEADARWKRGKPIGDLDGVPVTVKDSINVAGLAWRHGAAANSQLPSATSDSPPAARLRESGAIIVAKTTMPDFGMLAAGISSLYGITRNPWNLERSPGGSSSGAAAALSAGVGYGAVGTDIAGSVRVPAGFCGLVAIKPTQGTIPHLPMSHMRSVGPMARSVDDLRSLFRVLAQPDARDTACVAPLQGRDPSPRSDLVGLRIGILKVLGYGGRVEDPVLDAVDAAAEAFREGGAQVEELGPAFAFDPYPPLERLLQVRALSELLALPPERRHEVEPHVTEWAMGAQRIDAVSSQRDVGEVAASASRLATDLSGYDAVLSPVFPTIGFPADCVGLDATRLLSDCGFTCWFNQTGQPAASVCFGVHQGMPVGVQVVGRRFSDSLVLRLCSWLEERRPFELVWPGETETALTGESHG